MYEDDDTAQTYSFTYDAFGNAYALKYNGTVYYYITNLQGDVMSIVDTQGNVVASYEYDPYGNLISGEPAENTIGHLNPIRYRGYVYDAESGCFYLQSRYYDPQLGRFLNADAFASTGQGILGNNMFVYCLNHPTCRKDILGNTSVEIFDSNGNGLSDDEEFAGSGGNGGTTVQTEISLEIARLLLLIILPTRDLMVLLLKQHLNPVV